MCIKIAELQTAKVRKFAIFFVSLLLRTCSALRKTSIAQIRNGIDQDFLDPTRPVNFKIYAGRSVSVRLGRPVILQKVFVHSSMHLMKNFQKREDHG